MINLTDVKICILEQLMCLNENVVAEAGVNDRFGKINSGMIDSNITQILDDIFLGFRRDISYGW